MSFLDPMIDRVKKFNIFDLGGASGGGGAGEIPGFIPENYKNNNIAQVDYKNDNIKLIDYLKPIQNQQPTRFTKESKQNIDVLDNLKKHPYIQPKQDKQYIESIKNIESKKNTQQQYQSLNPTPIKMPSQYTTDYTKPVDYLQPIKDIQNMGNIFGTPESQKITQNQLKNPKDPLAIYMDNQRQKTMIGAIDDMLINNQTEEQFRKLYPDMSEQDKQTILGLTFDMNTAKQKGDPIHSVVGQYMDLPKFVQRHVADTYSERLIDFDIVRQRLRDNNVDKGPLGPLLMGISNAIMGVAEGGQKLAKGTDIIIGNILNKPVEKNIAGGINEMLAGGISTYFNAFLPGITAAFSIANETPVVGDILQRGFGLANKTVGFIADHSPIKNFKDSLQTPEEKAEFDSSLTAILMAVGLKGLKKEGKQVGQTPTGTPKLPGTVGPAPVNFGNIVSQALTPFNKIVDAFNKKYESEFKTVGPTPGSASSKWQQFVKFAEDRGYPIPEGKYTEGYQQFVKLNQDLPKNEPVRPQVQPQGQTQTQAQPQGGFVKKADDFVKTYVSELDKDIQKSIRTNPYTKSYWESTLQKIDIEGVPTDLKQLMREPLQEVGNTLLKQIDIEKDRLSDSGPLYNNIRQNKEPVDITPAKQTILDILLKKDIRIQGDGVLNFDRSAISSQADMTSIQKLFNRVLEINEINGDQLLNMRRFADDLSKRDKGVSGDGAYIIKQIRAAIDDVAKKTLTGLSELDKKYATQRKEIAEIEEGLFYRDVRRRGQVKDNFLSIIKNIGGENRARMRNTLSRIMPDLDMRVEAIQTMPKLAKAYTTTPGFSKKISGVVAGGIVGGIIGGGPIGALIGTYLADMMGSSIFSGMKKKAIKNIIDKISPEGEQILKDINEKIKNREQLLKDEKEFIDKLKTKIEQANKANIKALPEGRPTPVGPKGVQTTPIGPEPTIPPKKDIIETTRVNYDETKAKKELLAKKETVRKEQELESAKMSIKQDKESTELYNKQQQAHFKLENFAKAKENGYIVSDSNGWKTGDVSPLGILDGGIVLDGARRYVRISGEKFLENEVKPVYREKQEIQVKNFGDRKNQYLKDGLDYLGVKTLEDLPKDIQDRFLAIVNQGAKGNMSNMSDKVDQLKTDFDNSKNIKEKIIDKPVEQPVEKKQLIAKKEVSPTVTKKETTPVTEKIKVTTKEVNDSTQTITIDKGEIKVTNRSGRDLVGSYTFPVEERTKLDKSFGNPNSNKFKFIEQKFKEAFPTNFYEFDKMVEKNQFNLNDRLIDAQINAINKATKNIPWKKENKEYNTDEKKPLLGKKEANKENKGLPVEKKSILQSKAMVKATEEPLIVEARKYKSAEEFKGAIMGKFGNKSDFQGDIEIGYINPKELVKTQSFTRPSSLEYLKGMKQEGDFIPPIVIQKNKFGRFEIVDGHNRYELLKNKKKIPVVIKGEGKIGNEISVKQIREEANSKGLKMKESIPQSKVMVKAPEEPLIAEARKYKSAEEFVKARGKEDGGFGIYRGKIADARRKEYLEPLQKNIKTQFSSDPIIYERSIDDYLKNDYGKTPRPKEKIQNTSLKEKLTELYGKEYANNYEKMLDTDLYDYHKQIREQATRKKEIANKKLTGQEDMLKNNEKTNITPETTFETLPESESIYDEAKRTGAKRISPEKIPHQQLTPSMGMTKMMERNLLKRDLNYQGFQKLIDKANILKEKYGSKMPNRSTGAYDSNPELMQDYRDWINIKENAGKFGDKNLDATIESLGYKRDNRITNEETKGNIREKVKSDYIDLIKQDISKGYRYPDAVLDYDKSFRTAVDSRARYEKGLNTSFSADDTRIVFDKVDEIGTGMKRQDGKILTNNQKLDIIEGVLDFSNYLNLDMKKLAKDNRWVYVHLNDKNPFLMKNISGLYRSDPKNGSISISVGGAEYKTKTTTAHELGHAIDHQAPAGKLFKSFDLDGLKYNFNRNGDWKNTPTKKRKYYMDDREIAARMIEQYVGIAKGLEYYYEKMAYWDKEIFNTKIKGLVEESIKENLRQYYK